MSNLLTKKDIAKEAGVSIRTVDRWIAAGVDFGRIKVGKRLVRFKKLKVEKALTRGFKLKG